MRVCEWDVWMLQISLLTQFMSQNSLARRLAVSISAKGRRCYTPSRILELSPFSTVHASCCTQISSNFT